MKDLDEYRFDSDADPDPDRVFWCRECGWQGTDPDIEEDVICPECGSPVELFSWDLVGVPGMGKWR